MLWDFTSERTNQFCKAWNTCVKLAYDLPRNTKTFIVDNYLAINFDSVMKELFSRYVNFVKSLQKSFSYEIRSLFEIIGYNCQSNTGRNLHFIQTQSGLDPYRISSRKIRDLDMGQQIPVNEMWRIPTLDRLLKSQNTLIDNMESTEEVDAIIDSVCTT